MRIEILSDAEEDLIAGATFYERQGTGLGDYFLNAIYSDIDSLLIARRVKGQLEVREKSSALLTLIAGGASFYSLGQIAEGLMKTPSVWLIFPTLGLAAATGLVSTLFIGISLKGDLLICLEEADELRKKSNR